MQIPSIKIGSHTISAGNRLFIIAELGTNYNGSLETAKRMIGEAAEAGADCIKLQWVIADEILHPMTGEVALPGGPTDLYSVFRSLEQECGFYEELKAFTEKQGLVFLCTPFGEKSAVMLAELNPVAFKVASPELNYDQLLSLINGFGKPLVLSTGVSTLSDIDHALSLLSVPVVLLHCITAYPAPESEYNVRLVRNLSAIFGLPAGISDHSSDPFAVPLAGLLNSASVLEKHFTLDRKGHGLDDPIALSPGDFSLMVKRIRETESVDPADRRRYIAGIIPEKMIEAISGDGIKRLAESELENYMRSNRSLHAVRAIPEGTLVTPGMIGVLRTEKRLRPGLPPKFLNTVIGKKTVRPVRNGDGIVWEDFLQPRKNNASE